MLLVANDPLKDDLKENSECIQLKIQKDLGLLLQRGETWPTAWLSK